MQNFEVPNAQQYQRNSKKMLDYLRRDKRARKYRMLEENF